MVSLFVTQRLQWFCTLPHISTEKTSIARKPQESLPNTSFEATKWLEVNVPPLGIVPLGWWPSRIDTRSGKPKRKQADSRACLKSFLHATSERTRGTLGTSQQQARTPGREETFYCRGKKSFLQSHMQGIYAQNVGNSTRLPSWPKLLQKTSLQRKCFGAINFVKITKESLYKANSLACFVAKRDTPVAATLQRKSSGGIIFNYKIITKGNVPRNYFVIISARMVAVKAVTGL